MLWFSANHSHTAPATAAAFPRDGEIVVFVSGKGGVGKTSVAVNLGIDLARRGSRTILVDADFGLANADVLLNVSATADIFDLLDPRRDVNDLLVAGPEGLNVLCGVSGLTRAGGPARFDAGDCIRALHRLRAEADVVLVDCGAGVSDALIALALCADRLVLTTTPEPTALTDAYATLKILHTRGFAAQVGVIVNMARTEKEAASAARRLARVSAQFLGLEVEDIGHVPFDRHVGAAVRSRVPVAVQYPLCAASVSIDEISSRLIGRRSNLTESPGLWARLTSLFL